MREPDLQTITSLGFKIFKIFQKLKPFSGIIYLIFVSLFHFRPVFSFCTREQKYSPTNIQVILFS